MLGAEVDDDPLAVHHPDSRPGHVDRRRAEERRDEGRARVAIDAAGSTDIFDHPVTHHRDPVRQRHGLDLIMGDVDSRDLQRPDQGCDLGPQPAAEADVEARQRLVHEQDRRLPADKRPAHRHSLALTAGQHGRLAVQRLGDLEPMRDFADSVGDDGLVHQAGDPQRKGEIVPDGQVRVERQILEDHGDVALVGRPLVGDVAVKNDPAISRILQPGDHPENGRLAAPRWPEEHQQLPWVDFQTDVVHGQYATVVDLGHLVNSYR